MNEVERTLLFVMEFIANPRRDAHATIAGFLYQANVTILRWIELQKDQRLELECGEDIDTVETAENRSDAAERRLLEQLKVRASKALTLRSPEALEALSNFCEHRKNSRRRMKLTHLRISNFQSFAEAPSTVHLEKMTFLLGPNGDSSGTSPSNSRQEKLRIS